VLTVDAARAGLRDAFAEESANRLTGLDRALAECDVDTLRLTAGEDFSPRLQRFFEQRRRR
jgi:hypothetical protein